MRIDASRVFDKANPAQAGLPGRAPKRARRAVSSACRTAVCSTIFLLLPAVQLCALDAPHATGGGTVEQRGVATRFPIALEQVSAALSAGGLDLGGATVRLMVQITASQMAPTLLVRSVAPFGTRGARIRMECAERGECLPFYVAAEWPAAEDARAHLDRLPESLGVLPQRHPAASAGSEDATRHTAAEAPAVSNAGARPSLPAVSAKQAVRAEGSTLPTDAGLRAGSRAKLILEGERLHIELAVVCLEGGDPGRTIRVTGLDHRQTYTAEIIDGSLLKGTL